MAKYNQDNSLPSHGRRAKAENVGTVRVRIFNYPGFRLVTPYDDSWEMYLNVNLEAKMYHATVEVVTVAPSRRRYVSVTVPSAVIDAVVKLAQDKDFMTLKNGEIFPELAYLDGRMIQIKVASDAGSVNLDNSCLEDTLLDGKLASTKKVFNTPFHRLAAIAYETLGIDPRADDVVEEEEDA